MNNLYKQKYLKYKYKYIHRIQNVPHYIRTFGEVLDVVKLMLAEIPCCMNDICYNSTVIGNVHANQVEYMRIVCSAFQTFKLLVDAAMHTNNYHNKIANFDNLINTENVEKKVVFDNFFENIYPMMGMVSGYYNDALKTIERTISIKNILSFNMNPTADRRKGLTVKINNNDETCATPVGFTKCIQTFGQRFIAKFPLIGTALSKEVDEPNKENLQNFISFFVAQTKDFNSIINSMAMHNEKLLGEKRSDVSHKLFKTKKRISEDVRKQTGNLDMIIRNNNPEPELNYSQ